MREKITGIYKITSPSGKVYIGQSKDIKSRFGKYKRMQCKRQSKLYASLTKYSPSSHQFEIINQCSVEVHGFAKRWTLKNKCSI